MSRYVYLTAPAMFSLLCLAPSASAQGFYTSGIWGLPLGGYRTDLPGYGYGYSTARMRAPRLGYALPAYDTTAYGAGYYGSSYGTGCYGASGASCYGASYSTGSCVGAGYGAGYAFGAPVGYAVMALPTTRFVYGVADARSCASDRRSALGATPDDAAALALKRANDTLDRINAKLGSTRTPALAPAPKQKSAAPNEPSNPSTAVPASDRDLAARVRWWNERAAEGLPAKTAKDAAAQEQAIPRRLGSAQSPVRATSSDSGR